MVKAHTKTIKSVIVGLDMDLSESYQLNEDMTYSMQIIDNVS